ncbi:MAG: branched-chain amino acid ABC transporter permease [Bradyrhizobiaceae bacterium]|nr:branched-chain amino acid ABC transporter permease [Bradyrhizobiaceae bacterium]
MGAQVLTVIIDGLLLGLIYAGIGLGLSLILGVMGVVNVAHSAFIMLGSYFAYELFRRAGIDPIISAALALPVFFLLGSVVYRTLITRVEFTGPTQGLIAMFGLMVLIENLGVIVWTTDARALTTHYTNTSFAIGPAVVAWVKVLAGGLALALIGAAWVFLHYTLTGRAIRAIGQDRDAAAVLGINVHQLLTILFGLGIACAGVAGVLLGMIYPFSPGGQVFWLAWAFLVVVLGGLGSVANTLVAGLVVGIIQTFAGAFVPFEFVYLILYTLLAVILIVRREGLTSVARRSI